MRPGANRKKPFEVKRKPSSSKGYIFRWELEMIKMTKKRRKKS